MACCPVQNTNYNRNVMTGGSFQENAEVLSGAEFRLQLSTIFARNSLLIRKISSTSVRINLRFHSSIF